ncbi:MAG: thiamine pyrophosphate-binding protein [Paracoccaceae bacterium]|nr:thiamine pyrophosphate-binding protein [Paracoccaceae bacterium]
MAIIETKRNGGQLLVESLIALGATKAFGVPGESYLPVLDALYDHQDEFQYVLCRQEGGAAFMAAAHGKLTNTPGICMVTRGPGATNAAIGVHTAMQDSSPMILFVGQVGTDMIGREAFQEVNYRAVFGTLAKWCVEIDSVNRLPEILARAWQVAMSGRPGPVVLALPEDMLSALTEAAPLTSLPRITEPSPAVDTVDAVRKCLSVARRPLILVGGTNWTQSGKQSLQNFAEMSDIPVICAFRFQDQIDNHSPVYCGEAGVGMAVHVKRLMQDADTILAINVRFGEMTTDGYTLLDVPIPKQSLIHVHGSDAELGKIYQPTLGIHAGPNAFAASLKPVKGSWNKWRQNARTDFEDSMAAPAQPSPVDMTVVMKFLSNRLPDDTILTNGAGNFSVWPNKFFKFGPKARLLAPQSGSMGYGVPAAIAAKVNYPDRTVVCFAGDGDFQMNCTELATAMQASAQPIILVLNNGIYGTIRAHQECHFPARVFGTTMINPDFCALARSYNFHAERVEKTQDFEAAFERALDSETGALLDLNISPDAITPRQTLSEMRSSALNNLGE